MKDVKIVYQKLKKNLESRGYININHIQIENKEKLAELGQIFRNPRYETFRLIYTKNNIVVGHEAISSRVPGYVKTFLTDKNGRINAERNIYKIQDRMKRLNANSYYMAHNHPSGSAKASSQDIETTKFFHEHINGFKGHLIINSNSYAWIDIKNGNIDVSDNNKITSKSISMQRRIEKKGIYNIHIKSRKDIINLMNNIKNNKDYSIVIATDSRKIPRIILDVPNKFLNMKNEQLKGYFQNISKNNGCNSIFLATDNEDVFIRSTKLIQDGILMDSVFYQEKNGKLYMYETPSFEKYNPTGKELFDSKSLIKTVRVCSNEEKYIGNYEKEKFLKVLYKGVGQLPKIIKIENTLEAKKQLVDGLIEVIPYKKDALILCNEEGKTLGKEANVIFDYDYVAGNCFIVGDDYIHGDFKSLTDKQIKDFTKDLILRNTLNKNTSVTSDLKDTSKGTRSR